MNNKIMGSEMIESVKEKKINEQIEDVLNSFKSGLPREIKDRFWQEYENCETEEGLYELFKKINKIISFREDSLENSFEEIGDEMICQKCTKEHLEKIKKKISILVKKALSGELPSIGEGKVAKIFVDSKSPLYCFKMIVGDRSIYDAENNIKQEVEFLEKMADVKTQGVRVPTPYYYQGSKEMHFYVMEVLNAVTLKDILEKKEPLPDSFDFNSFFDNLEKFVKEMNEKKHIYHRDLHEENVMIDKKTGEAYIIDFGSATFHIGDQADAYIKKRSNTGKQDIVYAVSDLEYIKRHKNNLKNIL